MTFTSLRPDGRGGGRRGFRTPGIAAR